MTKINFDCDKQHKRNGKINHTNCLQISIIRYLCELINN